LAAPTYNRSSTYVALAPGTSHDIPYPSSLQAGEVIFLFLSNLSNPEFLSALDLALWELEKGLFRYAKVGPELLEMANEGLVLSARAKARLGQSLSAAQHSEGHLQVVGVGEWRPTSTRPAWNAEPRLPPGQEGRNNWGQLGDGTTRRNAPVKVSGLSGVQAIDGGGNHSLAVTSSDTTPPPTTDPVPGPPTVESTIPNANERGVARTIDIKATFSEDMNSDTITGNTFKLFKKGSTTTIAAAAPNYDAATKTATLNPNRDLTSGVTYKAVVTMGVEDSVGNPLAQQYRWFFTVSQ